jgi:hypothetical protein
MLAEKLEAPPQFDRNLYRDVWQSCLQKWPELANPAPPVPLPWVDGTFSLYVADEWAKIEQRVAEGTFALRCPVTPDTESQLVGPFKHYGYCLRPLTREGALSWIDPTLPAQDGDMVSVHIHEDEMAAIVERCAGMPGWLSTYGSTPAPTAMKILKRMGHRYYLMTNESCFELGKNQILGVVRHLEIDGHAIGAARTNEIAPGAATIIASATDAGGTVHAVAGGGIVTTDYGTVSYTPSVDCTGICIAFGNCALNNISAIGSAYARIQRVSSPFTSQQDGQNLSSGATNFGAQTTMSLLAGIQYQASLRASAGDNGVSTSDNVVSNVRVIFELIYK